MFAFLGRLAFRRRWSVLAGTALFLVCAAIAGVSVFGAVKSGGFDDPEAESAKAGVLLADRFDAGSPDLVVLARVAEGVDAPTVAASGRELTDRLTAEPGVERVVSYWRSGDPGLRAADGRKALLLVGLAGTEEELEVVAARLVADYSGSKAGPGLDVVIGGPAALGNELGETIGADLGRAEAIAIPITLVLLLLVFGSVIAALLPLAVGVIAIFGTFLALFLITLTADVSVFAINLATALGLGLAIDYSLLIVSRFREELGKGLDTEAAVARTLQTAGRTVAFSAVTVAISLSALLIFPLYFLRSFAYAGIAVVAIAAGTAVLTLPALLAVLGRRVDRFAVGRKRAKASADNGFWHRVAHTVMRRPVLTGAPVALLLAVLAVPFLGVNFGLPDDRDLPASSVARTVGDSIRADFGGGSARAFPVVVPNASPAQTTEAAVRISAVPEVSRVDTVTGTFAKGVKVADPNPRSARFGDPGGAYLEVSSDVEPVSAAGEDLIARLRALDVGVPILVAGPAADLVDSKDAIFGLVPLALGIVALATFVLLFLMTGSVLVPIKAIVLNILSLGATFGAMVWVFQNGRGADLLGFTTTGALNTTIPILMFCIAFGLSMDYEVFLLSRIKEYHDQTGDTATAVATGLQQTGRIMTAAAGVLAVTFLAFATSQVTFIKLMGLGLTLAILLDATLVRGVLVPAFMRLAGEANWWAPAPLRRLHQRFGLAEEGPRVQPPPEKVLTR
ncbi:MMPL family transporter [Actinokineospora sp.]|uniref:MMPL family transporter n=1 Tax=Actinokineospora sp. TaxID=1872133 RepID=UPI004037EFF3